jgi:hypothetical protein
MMKEYSLLCVREMLKPVFVFCVGDITESGNYHRHVLTSKRFG